MDTGVLLAEPQRKEKAMTQNEPTRAGGSKFATWALVLGIASFVPVLGFFCAIGAIICGAIALSQMKRQAYPTGMGKAITGIVLGGVMVLLTPVVALLIAI